MQNEVSDINLRLGRVMGQLDSLVSTLNVMAGTITRLEERLRANETSTNTLTVKMTILGIISGGAGSAIISLILKKFGL